jgi:hypothetical protein
MHLEQAVLDGRRRIVEGQQVINPLDQGIALGQFLFGKILGVAVTAGLDHPGPFHVEFVGPEIMGSTAHPALRCRPGSNHPPTPFNRRCQIFALEAQNYSSRLAQACRIAVAFAKS